MVLARAPDVVHDLLPALLLDRLADAPTDVGEGFVPRRAHELAATAFADTLERIEDPLGILDLVERRRPLRTRAPAAAGVHGVAFELVDLPRGLVDVREQAAGGFAVEAGCGNEHVVPLDRRPTHS